MVVMVFMVVLVSVAAFQLATSDRSFRPLECFQTTFAPRAAPQAETSQPFRPFTTTDFRRSPFKNEENRVLFLASNRIAAQPTGIES